MMKEPRERRHGLGYKVHFSEYDVFFSASQSGESDEVEEMIKRGFNINTRRSDGLTAVHQAVLDGKFDMVKLLVEHGADINAPDDDGWTPLHSAVGLFDLEIVRYLCLMGADLTAVNCDGNLPIDLVAGDDCKRYLEVQYAKRMIAYDEYRHRELKMMKKDCADWIANGKFGDRPHQRTGATALHVAAAKNYKELIVPLLNAGADVNSRDFDGWTPLHAAAHFGHLEACKLLVENGASFEQTTSSGESVMHVAAETILDELKEIESGSITPCTLSFSSSSQCELNGIESESELSTSSTQSLSSFTPSFESSSSPDTALILKENELLRIANKRLREENAAMIRVIAKLSC